MKTILSILLMALSGVTLAQQIELCGFAGYQLNGKVKLYDGEFRMDNAMNYGGKLALNLAENLSAELTYMRSDSRARFETFGVDMPGDWIDYSSNYFQLGAVKSFPMGNVEPFSTLAIGWVHWSPKDDLYDRKNQFSALLGAGVKIWLNEILGIRIQGSMLMPMVWNGVGFGCGIGTGGSSCGANAYSRITPFQGEFSGGLIFRFSH